MFKDPSYHSPKWDHWFGPSGRDYDEILNSNFSNGYVDMLGESLAGSSIAKIIPRAFENFENTRKNAEV